MKEIAYHEAGHAIIAAQTINLNYGLELHSSGNYLGIAFQKFQIQKYLYQNPSALRLSINNDLKKIHFIKKNLEGYVLTLLSGQIAERIYLNLPAMLTPNFIAESDDEKFGDALNWYCSFMGYSLNNTKLLRCYHDINLKLHELFLENETLWFLISVLAESLYNSPKKKLSGFKTMRIIFYNQFKLAFKGKHSTNININIFDIIDITCC